MDAWTLDAWTVDAWTLGPWSQEIISFLATSISF